MCIVSSKSFTFRFYLMTRMFKGRFNIKCKSGADALFLNGCQTGVIWVKSHDLHVDKTWEEKEKPINQTDTSQYWTSLMVALKKKSQTYSSIPQRRALDSQRSRHKAASRARSPGHGILPRRGARVPVWLSALCPDPASTWPPIATQLQAPRCKKSDLRCQNWWCIHDTVNWMHQYIAIHVIPPNSWTY